MQVVTKIFTFDYYILDYHVRSLNYVFYLSQCIKYEYDFEYI